jgi:predicted metal-binding protein
MPPREVRQVDAGMHEDRLALDLEQYTRLALNLGASRAVVMSVRDIPVDERVVLKCQVPRCFGYGACAHCPPHTLSPGDLRALLAGYEWAIFFSLNVPSEIIVRDRATREERIDAYLRVFDLISEVESAAFHHGHYRAFGLGAGSCRHSLCATQEDCKALKGEKCRFSLRSRPSMEAVGIDVYQMAARLGWEVYPIGSSLQAQDVPHGMLAGVVVVQ